MLAHYRARPRAAQRGLPFAGPRRIGEHLIGSPLVRALASFPLTGDERSPIRGDTLRVAVIGYALTGPMLIDEPTGALLFGANTEANRKRFWEIELFLDLRTGSKPCVRWTSYNSNIDSYQGELIVKERYTKQFVESRHLPPDYHKSRLELLLDHLSEVIVGA